MHLFTSRFAAIAGALFLGLGLLAVGPVLAQAGGLELLGNLTKGEWTIKFRDGSPDRKICVRSGMELIQIRHTGQNCNRFIVEDAASKVTVQYTCPGNGYGRTNIRRETSSLAQIQAQGFESGQPFQFEAEARRTGTC